MNGGARREPRPWAWIGQAHSDAAEDAAIARYVQRAQPRWVMLLRALRGIRRKTG